MRELVADERLIAACGLYCGACGRYLRELCPGCRENAKATWCKVRACCLATNRASCADCPEFPEATGCRKFHNFLSRLIGFVLRSDRPACIRQIRAVGRAAYAQEMCAARKMTRRR